MQYSLVAQATETGMTVYYLDSFTNYDVAEYGKEGEDGWESRLAVDDEEWDVVDFESIRQVPYACSSGIGVSDDDHLVAAIYEFLKIVRIV